MRIYPTDTVDQEFKTLGDAGYTGSLNDRQFAYLRAQGFTGALPDMHKQLLDDPYVDFTSYVGVASAADYTTDTNVNKWINRASSGTTYDWVQTVGVSQPTAASDGLTFDNTNDYLRCTQIVTDLQEYIAASAHPNIMFMHRVTLTDGDGLPPGFLSAGTYWSAAPNSGNGYLIAEMQTTGRYRRTLRNTLNVNVVSFDLVLPPGELGPGTYTIVDHFHDGLLDTYYAGALCDSRSFDFTPLFTANNPFATANFTMGARLTNNTTTNSQLSGTVHEFAYVKDATVTPVFP